MKKRIVVVDLLVEPGHIKLVRKICSILSIRYDIVFISSREYCAKIGVRDTVEISNKLFSKKNRRDFVINQIRAIRIVKAIINEQYFDAPVLFTSFENISASLFLKIKNKCLAMVHNNLEKSPFSTFFLNLMSRKTTFLVYEKYISDFLEKFNLMSAMIPHTLHFNPSTEEITNDSSVVFAPSASLIPEEYDMKIAEFLVGHNLVLSKKSKRDFKTDLIEERKFFTDYDKRMRTAKYILIHCPYDNRISGVFYEAMSMNKIILTVGKEGLFVKAMKNEYPSSVFLIESIKVTTENEKLQDFRKFVSKHSDMSILTSLSKILESE